MRTWLALARGVALESLRRKDLWVVAILGFLIVISAGAIGFFGSKGLESFAKDVASTVLGGFSSVMAIVTAARLMPDEIKNRTLYPLLARPISRLDLILGKLTGAIFVSWVAFLLLGVLTLAALSTFGVRPEPLMLQYALAKMMGLVVVCSVTLMLSLIMTPSAAITTAFILVFGSNMISRALVMASETASPNQIQVFQVINGALPQTSLYDLGSRLANNGWGPVPMWVMTALLGYMVAYSAAMVALGWAKFRRQAV